MMIHASPLAVFDHATVWYDEEGARVRHEGHVEMYENYVRLCGGVGSWVPRENVEQVLER
jgi:hypothetical protein